MRLKIYPRTLKNFKKKKYLMKRKRKSAFPNYENVLECGRTSGGERWGEGGAASSSNESATLWDQWPVEAFTFLCNNYVLILNSLIDYASAIRIVQCLFFEACIFVYLKLWLIELKVSFLMFYIVSSDKNIKNA